MGPSFKLRTHERSPTRSSCADILKTLGDVAPQVPAPLVTMVSYAIVYRHGLEKYVDDVRSRGLAGLIVPDLPVEESPR